MARILLKNSGQIKLIHSGIILMMGVVLLLTACQSDAARPSQVVFLAPATDAADVWIATPGETPQALTRTGGEVLDYAVSQDGQKLAYIRRNLQKGADVWVIDRQGKNDRLLVSCGVEVCASPAWLSDSSNLVFARQSTPAAPPQLWKVEIAAGTTAAWFSKVRFSVSSISASPDGRWLSFYDRLSQAVILIELQSGVETVLRTPLEQITAWSPDSRNMALVMSVQTDLVPLHALFEVDLATQALRQVPWPGVADGVLSQPIYSPDSAWLMAGITPGRLGVARQLWRFPVAGGEPQPLTNDFTRYHAKASFDPTGRLVVMQRLEGGRSANRPEVVVVDISTGQETVIQANARQPAWLP
jgi:Tol biopolymer transport system component